MLKNKEEVKNILDEIEKIFPNPKCELIYHNIYELSVATILSAQTTDKSVNKVTPKLFEKYPTIDDLAKANYDDVKEIIMNLGLANNKAKNIIGFAVEVQKKFGSKIPADFDDLVTLPGVGRKTANVILVEGFKIPRIPVDTHVERVSKRLGIVRSDASVLDVEKTLMKLVPEERYHATHHLLLLYGRYYCTAKKPLCDTCFYQKLCQKEHIK